MITIYTDGSCLGNPGKGGWAAIILIEEKKIKIKGGKKNTTNNQMELMAPIQALKKIPAGKKVEIYTDSKYVMDGVNKWLPNWKEHGWRTANKKPVKNQDLWQLLDQSISTHNINWQWVRGHTGNPGNEEADALANKGIDELI